MALIFFEWFQKQSIYYKYIIFYLLEINGIDKQFNKIINIKGQIFIANMRIYEKLWPETIKTLVYLAN